MDDVRMEKTRIAVTGIGGGAGQSIIKSLYDTDYEIVGLDGELLATGLYAVPISYRIPYANSLDYIPRLISICQKENIKLLFPGLDAELSPLANHRDEFDKIGTKVVVSSPEVIEISNDKFLTYKKLKSVGISVPETYELINYNYNLDFPLIVKQQKDGARSKNVFLIKNEISLNRLLSDKDFKREDYIIQEYIEGDEYTCGSINVDEACKGVILMRRILRDGDTYKCFSEKNERIESDVFKVMNAIKPFGACNIQLRVRNGIPFIFEINARCSGTTAARTLCGFNEPKMIADFLLKNKQPEYSVKELSILRYWKELVVENDSILELSKNGCRMNPSKKEL